MRIEMNHEDELLIVPQVAYLLGRTRSSIEKLVIAGMLSEVSGKHRRLIRAVDLRDYVEQQLEKYERVNEWKGTENKKEYWILKEMRKFDAEQREMEARSDAKQSQKHQEKVAGGMSLASAVNRMRKGLKSEWKKPEGGLNDL